MSVTFQILPARGLVYVRYEGFAKVADTSAALTEYAAHPDCRPGQKQLVDMTRMTGFEPAYGDLMAVQAQKADLFAAQGTETLLVYLVSNRENTDLVRLILNSWEATDGVVPIIQTEEHKALQILGQPEISIKALLDRVA